MLDDDGGRPELDNDGGHLGLAEQRNRHASDSAVLDAERVGHEPLDELGEPAPARRLGSVAGVVGGGASDGVRIEPNPDQHIGLAGVCLARLDRVIGLVHRRDASAGGKEVPPQGRQRRGKATGLADCHVSADQGRRGLPQLLARPHVRDELGAAVARLHSEQLANREGPDDAVDSDADVALEVDDSGCRVVAKDAVDAATVEAERAETLLELGNVVTPEHGRGPEKRPLAQPKPGLHQGIPGLGAAGPIDPEAAPMLERLDGSTGRRAEARRRILFGGEAELSQSVSQIGDGVTARALREREDLVCPYR